jgi:hypothetical protein
MRKVSDLITDLNKKRPGGEDAKSRQPRSKHYPDLTDPRNPLFIIYRCLKTRRRRKSASMTSSSQAHREWGINGVEPKFAPLKSVERAMAKVYEKYDCLLDMLTDLARGTIVVSG